MNQSEVLYSFVTEPSSKRRDLLNLAIENIELIRRTDILKELRERKIMIMESLKEEIGITNKAIKHFETLMPLKIKEEHEKIQEKVERSKVKIENYHKIEKMDELGMELEDIRNKLNNLNF
ncbi:hypothetical protein J4446_02720 [Candidatus Woesearchaeota archaeon]|nr:hypothetical protein [Candidatus Woesearchaeota archaeon]